MCARVVSGRSACWMTRAVAAASISLILTSVGCRRASTLPPPPPPPPPPLQTDSTLPDSDKTGQEAVAQAGETKHPYARHCAACHGAKGDGRGIAAAYLYPKPRDFRAGRFRLVSTVNRTPSRDDLLNVLRRGMPGSSMPPWDHLSDEELDLLVGEVQRMHREGARDQYVQVLMDEEELTPEEIQAPDIQKELQQFVERHTQPGDTTSLPTIGQADAAAIARGKELYVRQAYNKCHGDAGRGDGGQKMVDDEGYPTTPRDFTAGIFKGGSDPASVYRRIAYGMPGTPMPSSRLTADQIIDLSHYVLSLSDEQTRQAARQKRRQISVLRLDRLPTAAGDPAWDVAEAVVLRMVPLWWRHDDNPAIHVQAAHDGKSLALRIRWEDKTNDAHAVTSSHFEDAVAVELYQGDKEPFLGMGGADSPVDVWFWDADRQSGATVDEQYPDAVVDIYPFSEPRVNTAESDRPGARTGSQPPISLPAVASGNPIAQVGHESGSGGSTLTAGGPQTVTFQLPTNQAVEARGKWEAGYWTVIMRRALVPSSSGGGIVLAPGNRVSVAFAVWNGAKNDRDGQKLITIWNDLLLEK